MKTLKTVLILLVLVLVSRTSFAAVYDVDPDHSTVSFKIRHLFSNVDGRFGKFQGTVEYEPGKSEGWQASGTIDTTTIDTNSEKRDAHLKSPDFFDVEKYPTIEFKTVKILEMNEVEGRAKGEGLITIHGIEKPIVIDAVLHGEGKDPWGNTRLGFTATTKLNRSDFGLTWNKTLETGNFLVGVEVTIVIEVEAIKRVS